MYKIFLTLTFTSLLFCSDLKIGTKMPKSKSDLKSISGDILNLSSVKGEKGTLIIFSCNTCPWVIRWEDRYLDIAEKYISKGIKMIAINSNVAKFSGDDSLIKMKLHAEKMNYNFLYAQDINAEIAIAFGAKKTPQVYLFDNNDILVYKGAIDDNARNARKVEEAYLTNAIDALLKNRKIKKESTKAIGCSIKFN
jgi:hypothetical protein